MSRCLSCPHIARLVTSRVFRSQVGLVRDSFAERDEQNVIDLPDARPRSVHFFDQTTPAGLTTAEDRPRFNDRMLRKRQLVA